MLLADAILAVLTLGECHGSGLAAEIGARTGGAVNAGQVAKTLNRLAADGLVEALPRDPQGRIGYRLTPSGREAAASWCAESVVDVGRLRLLASLPGADRDTSLAAQRRAFDALLDELPPPVPLAEPPRRGRPQRPK